MKKLLLGAMMSALFVMNADAGFMDKMKSGLKKVGTSVKNVSTSLQHKIKKDRTMDEKTEIQPFKAYLSNIIKTMGNLYKKITDTTDKEVFGKAQDAMKKFVINVARKSYVKGATCNEDEVSGYINEITKDEVWGVLREHIGETEYNSFITAVNTAYNFANGLLRKYSSNSVLSRTVAGLANILYVVSGNKAEAEDMDYKFRLEEAARLEAEAEAKAGASTAQEFSNAWPGSTVNFEPEEFGNTETMDVVNESGNLVQPNDTYNNLEELRTETIDTQQPVYVNSGRGNSGRGKSGRGG